MSSLDQLYQQIILDHSKHPHGRGLEPGEETSHQRNPVCGDEITLALRWEPPVAGDAAAAAAPGSDRLAGVAWEGAGCSISQASASLLVTLVEESREEGPVSPADLSAMIEEFRTAMRSRGTIELDEERFGDAAALSGVSRYVARVKCAMLAWVAAEDLLARRAAG
ncbi:SUF system NifU family Fe-S cluster assembly protein [Microcella daejeonensis]|uniref:SUF system NifU family Fe-S cluster assembly protein n=1 Tax=Microcella daejeonensis TaxID=2994971 RepID=A0A9E8MJ13_9MICO|nr:SUF system NifU family Fe-S cluster assembly protein [Microcella daejeonensis]WAB80470.1 SUF system NifU family Fe-S cluster assembly protein [Microcella daejeonensis]